MKLESSDLPQLQDSIVDDEFLDSFFTDLEYCAKILSVMPRRAIIRGDTPVELITLQQAKEMLLEKSVKGIQIRYLYNGSEWWDTLTPTNQGIRIVRIPHSA